MAHSYFEHASSLWTLSQTPILTRGSALASTPFLIYINDLRLAIPSIVLQDDSTLHSSQKLQNSMLGKHIRALCLTRSIQIRKQY